MAEENLDLGEEKKSKPIIRYAGVALAVIALSLAVLFFAKLGPFAESGGSGEGDEGVVKESAKTRDAIYSELAPSFTVNFDNSKDVRLLQVSISVLTYDPKVAEALQKHMPMIRNNLLMIFSNSDPDGLQAAEGKNTLREKIQTELSDILDRQEKLEGIEAVFFTKFITQ